MLHVWESEIGYGMLHLWESEIGYEMLHVCVRWALQEDLIVFHIVGSDIGSVKIERTHG